MRVNECVIESESEWERVREVLLKDEAVVR